VKLYVRLKKFFNAFFKIKNVTIYVLFELLHTFYERWLRLYNVMFASVAYVYSINLELSKSSSENDQQQKKKVDGVPENADGGQGNVYSEPSSPVQDDIGYLVMSDSPGPVGQYIVPLPSPSPSNNELGDPKSPDANSGYMIPIEDNDSAAEHYVGLAAGNRSPNEYTALQPDGDRVESSGTECVRDSSLDGYVSPSVRLDYTTSEIGFPLSPCEEV